MKKSDLMVALTASLGVGAATFYTMSKSNQPLNTAVENITPMLNSIASVEGNANGSPGQNSNTMNGNTSSISGTQGNTQQLNKQQEQQFQTNMMN